MKKLLILISIILFFSCDDPEIYGCTDSTACNFNPEANVTGNRTCYYPEPYLDCDSICLMDTDNDGICDNDDANSYETVLIGEQLWMSENLKTTHYSDGESILNITNNNDWIELNNEHISAYSFYNNNNSNQMNYGNLYNWYAVNDERNICPEGWHVSSLEDWEILIDFLGGDSLAGGKLKEPGYYNWIYYSEQISTETTNESQFAALGGGYRASSHGGYYYLLSHAYFWTGTEYNENRSNYITLLYNSSSVGFGYDEKKGGMSVRCLKD